MKSIVPNLRNCFFVFAICLSTTHVLGQNFPPAQGPPPPPAPFSEFATSVIINFVKTTIQTTIDTINADIIRDAKSTGIQAHLSFTLTAYKPGMSTTTYPNRPNQNVVRIAFIVSYDVTGIRYHGIPYFSRKLGQSIELLVSCNNWFTNQGTLAISSHTDRPYLDGSSFAEAALNFFIAHTLTDLVDSKLRARLPNGSNSFTPIPTSPCNCLGVNPGSAPNYTDGEITFKKINKPIIPISVLDTTVTIQSIKRLSAHVGGVPYYKEVEDIQLEFYVNQTSRVTQLTGMREGEQRNLSLQNVIVSRLGANGMIVLIANIAQQPLLSQSDTRFYVFKKNVSFGNGIQKLIVPKTYWEQPHRLPNGSLTKPIQRQIDAYEITVLIKVPNIDIKQFDIKHIGIKQIDRGRSTSN